MNEDSKPAPRSIVSTSSMTNSAGQRHEESIMDPNATSIQDLPLELWVDIYLRLPDRDAVALSTTCKQARAIYDSDLRIGFQSVWAQASRLLDMRRPGNLPTWKVESLQRHMLSKRWKDHKTGGVRYFDWFGVGEESKDGTDVEEWVLEGLPKQSGYSNQGSFAKRIFEQQRLFFKRVAERPILDVKLPIRPDPVEGHLCIPAKKISAIDRWRLPRVSLTTSEKDRLVNVLYRMMLLEMDTSSFACFGKVSHILNYAPLMEISFCESLEIAVLLKSIFLESTQDRTEGRYMHRKKNEIRQPIFNTSRLRSALTSILTIKSRLYGHILDRQGPFTILSLGYPYNLNLSQLEWCSWSPAVCATRGMFWDINKADFDLLFELLETTISLSRLTSQFTFVKALLSCFTPGGISNYHKVLSPALEVLRLASDIKMKLDFIAVRVSNEGVLCFDEDGDVIDDDSVGGRWDVFRKRDLQKVQLDRRRYLARDEV
ncbi:hypothetical protein BJ508DRAFT_311654 [Ascobolus immersus RN42]|uniref:F-box domain-containing protein n=1 Tax=Ascobolus immersus RN42 TaxID=1160509 RepID=A0A3N4HPV2_ASCIM|nr:hypothetical protein BJ508DRAFT_311654 [Ascobolus immersus RN42]